MRLKSPMTSQGPDTAAARASISAANADVRLWSDGAYTLVTVNSISEVVDARRVVKL
jgi:hypothetical protein